MLIKKLPYLPHSTSILQRDIMENKQTNTNLKENNEEAMPEAQGMRSGRRKMIHHAHNRIKKNLDRQQLFSLVPLDSGKKTPPNSKSRGHSTDF